MTVESFLKTELSLHFLRREKEQNEKALHSINSFQPEKWRLQTLEKGNIIEIFLVCDKV